MNLYHSDLPTTADALGFSDFRPALTEVLLYGQTPLTVGIFGRWGTGKTSLLRMLRQDVEAWGRRLNLPVRTVWFTAWKYERREALWRALLLRVLHALQPAGDDETARTLRRELARLETALYRPVEWEEVSRWVVDWWQAFKSGGRVVAEIMAALLPLPAGVQQTLLRLMGAGDGLSLEDLEGLVQALRREVHTYRMEQLTSTEQFEEHFRRVLQRALGRGDQALGRLVLFVDDLDRCLPEKAVEVLEAIKLFLEVEGTAFVLALDREVIRQGIELYYGRGAKEPPIDGDAYLEKFIQIPFTLPPLETRMMDRMMAVLDGQRPAETPADVDLPIAAEARTLDEDLRTIFTLGLHPNPRQVKRALNTFRLLQAVALVRENRGRLPPHTAWPLLAKIVVLQLEFPEIYELWLRPGHDLLLRALEKALLTREAAGEKGTATASGFAGFLQEQRKGDDLQDAAPFEPDWLHDLVKQVLEHLRREPQRFIRFRAFFLYEPAAPPEDRRKRYRFASLEAAELQSYRALAAPMHLHHELTGPYADIAQAVDRRDAKALWWAVWSYRHGPPEAREDLRRWLPFLLEREDVPPWMRETAHRLLNEDIASLVRHLVALAVRAPDPEQRQAALYLLSEGKLLHRVVGLLAEPEWQDVALQVLESLGPLSLPVLLEHVNDARLQDRVVEVLIRMGRRDAQALRTLLQHPNPEVRLRALQGLAEHSQDALAPDVLPLCRDEDPRVRRAALQTLAAMEYLPAASQALECLRDKDPEVRKAARQALMALGPAVVPLLLEHLAAPSRRLREQVWEILASMSGPPVLEALRQRLIHENPKVREAACWLLGQVGEPEDVARLLALLRPSRNEPVPVRRAVLEALQALYRRHPAEVMDALLALLLGEANEDHLETYLEALETLLPALDDEGVRVVRQALQHLMERTLPQDLALRVQRLLERLPDTL